MLIVYSYFNQTSSNTNNYTLSLHDALPILKNQKDSLFNDQVVQTLQMRYESNRQLEIIEEKEKIITEQSRIQKANIRIFFASAGSLGLVASLYYCGTISGDSSMKKT